MSWRTVHLDDLPAIPGPGTLTWRPVRRTLDVRAFGCNAYTAAEAGSDVVEPHTEDVAWEWSFEAESLLDSDPPRARELLDEALRLHPGSPGARFDLARWQARHGSRDEAARLLREALEITPELREELPKHPELSGLAGA